MASGDGAGGVQLRTATKAEREAQRILQEAGIQFGSTHMAEKRGSGQSGEVIEPLQTNLHGIVVNQHCYAYRYDVKIIAHGSRRDVELTMPVPGEVEMLNRRGKCSEIFRLLKEQHPGFFRDAPFAVFYDQQAILYAMSKLPVEDAGITLEIDQGLSPVWRIVRCSVTVRPVSGAAFRLLLTEFPQGNDARHDAKIEQFLGILTNQSVIFSETKEHVIFVSGEGQGKGENSIFLTKPENFRFDPREHPNLAPGVCLGIGCTKSTRYIEGPGNTANDKTMAILVQGKKTPFFAPEEVINVVQRMIEVEGKGRLNPRARVTNDEVLKKLTLHLKGLTVETVYGKPLTQRFRIFAVAHASAREKMFEYEGENITIENYFARKYNIKLQYPDFNLLVRNTQNECFYPMELVRFAEHQKLRDRHNVAMGVDRRTMVEEGNELIIFIQKCSMQPDALISHNQRMIDSMKLDDNNRYLQIANVNFFSDAMEVNARMLTPPAPMYAGDAVSRVEAHRGYTWAPNRYLIPARCDNWGAYCLIPPDERRFNQADLQRFVMDCYMVEIRRRGMEFTPPRVIQTFGSNISDLQQVIKSATEMQLKFVLVVHKDESDGIHNPLKLLERQTGVVTQGLKILTVQKVIQKGQVQTVQNIVNKTNMKLGGLNYSLHLGVNEWTKETLGTNTLYVGFGVNHPAGGFAGFAEEENGNGNGSGSGSGSGNRSYSGSNGGNGAHAGTDSSNGQLSGDDSNGNGLAEETNGHTLPKATTTASGPRAGSPHGSGDKQELQKTPSVIGYSANTTANPFEFIGDFVYQPARRDEKVGIIRDVITRCIQTYTKNRGYHPERIIIYRNGCSEGQFYMILKYEVPLIKLVLGDIPLSVVVSNKVQKIRFFPPHIDPRAKPSDKNIQPGTVVDSGAVHPNFTEFFLASSRALQGTARCPKYTLLYDDSKLSMGILLSMDKLENITYQLSYGHQIVNLPVSLPAPVYIAEEYAKRGRNLFNQYTRDHGELPNFEDYSNALAYRLHPELSKCRVNA